LAQFDLVIIGAGPGGYVAAIRAGQLGMKVLVIERDERLGGTCLLRGCIPTKCLLHSADVLEEAQHGEKIGVHAENVRVEMKGVNDYKDKVVAKNAKGVEFLFRKNKVERLHGHAKLVGPGKISVTGGKDEGQIVEAKIDGRQIVTSDELLRNDVVPKRLIVLGAGAVGVEFASVYRRFGSEVTIVEMMPRLLPVEDEDISAEMEKALRRKGVRSMVGAKLEKVEVFNEVGVRALVTTAKGVETLEAEMFLCAVGRRPVTENCGLENFPSIKMDRGFVPVDPKTLLTSEPWLSAIGDIVSLPGRPHPQLAHLAQGEGQLRSRPRRDVFGSGGRLGRPHREAGEGQGLQGPRRHLPVLGQLEGDDPRLHGRPREDRRRRQVRRGAGHPHHRPEGDRAPRRGLLAAQARDHERRDDARDARPPDALGGDDRGGARGPWQGDPHLEALWALGFWEGPLDRAAFSFSATVFRENDACITLGNGEVA
jgi:pyruvate/2-oxoglutarate dehydrogenase complex dihydrolipoamide dehydrogenase (E3) component